MSDFQKPLQLLFFNSFLFCILAATSTPFSACTSISVQLLYVCNFDNHLYSITFFFFSCHFNSVYSSTSSNYHFSTATTAPLPSSTSNNADLPLQLLSVLTFNSTCLFLYFICNYKSLNTLNITCHFHSFTFLYMSTTTSTPFNSHTFTSASTSFILVVVLLYILSDHRLFIFSERSDFSGVSLKASPGIFNHFVNPEVCLEA